jgi:hypothetical protein
MKKGIDSMTIERQFGADTSPALILLDVQGRRNRVASPDLAILALEVADQLQDLGGSGRETSIPARDGANPESAVLLYYRSHGGRPTRSEISRAAKIIAESAIRDRASPLVDDEALFVTGRRAVVHPAVAGAKGDAVPFLISTSVWYNENRVTVGFPAGADQVSRVIEDINARLTEGAVSAAR